MPQTRRDVVFFVLGGFFLTNAIVAELTGGKLFVAPRALSEWLGLGEVVLSIGVIPWPVVFITTDLVNEYFGRAGVRRLTYLAVVMILYSFLVLLAATLVPAWTKSPVGDDCFSTVFGQSMWIIAGSVTAFLISQLLDVTIFSWVRRWTGRRLLWIRATGSTVVSQLVDTLIVGFIAFVIPGKLSLQEFLPLAKGNYLFKIAIAVMITPVIYGVHSVIDAYLKGDNESATGSATPTAP